jgi:hypothetical protein
MSNGLCGVRVLCAIRGAMREKGCWQFVWGEKAVCVCVRACVRQLLSAAHCQPSATTRAGNQGVGIWLRHQDLCVTMTYVCPAAVVVVFGTG